MRRLVLLIVMVVAVTGYKKGRYSAAFEDFPPYTGTRHEQHFPFREQSLKTQQYQSYRHRPYRQDLSSYPEQLLFKDQPHRDYSSLKRPYYEDLSFKDSSELKSRPFLGDRSSFKDSLDFKGSSRPYLDDSSSFKDPLNLKGPNQHYFDASLSFKDTFQGQNRPYFDDSSSFKNSMDFKGSNRPFYEDSTSSKDTMDFKGSSRPFYEDSLSSKDSMDFKGSSSVFANGMSLKDHQSQQNETPEFHQFREDPRFADMYGKSIDSYMVQRVEPQTSSLDRDLEYLKHGNHGLGYASVPPVSPYALPLNGEPSPTMAPSMPPTATHTPLLESTVSSTATTMQDHTSATSEPKMALAKTSHTMIMPTAKSNTLAGASTTSEPTPPVSTMPPVTAKQSSDLAHPPTVLTTEASLPIMSTESPAAFFGRQKVSPIEFQGEKPAQAYYYISNVLKNKLHQPLLGNPLSRFTKNGINLNEHSTFLNQPLSNALTSNQLSQLTKNGINLNGFSSFVNQPLSNALSNNQLSQLTKHGINLSEQSPFLNQQLQEMLSSNLNNKIQGSVLNYVVPEESKIVPKDNLQSSLLNYLLQQELNRGLSYQQSPVSGSTNYAPLQAIAEKPKITLPSVSIGSLSAVSRPLQTLNYLSTSTLPRVPTFSTQDSSVSSVYPLGASSSGGLSSSVFNSLPVGLSDGISAGIPGSISPGVSTGIPTLNFGQNLQHVGQLRQLEPARSEPYSTGLQLQLGGFGGIDYTLRSANPVQRSTDFGIAKVGLSLPELPRYQLPTVSKMGLEHLW